LAKPGMTVIPVLVDDAALPATADLPEDIRALTECQVRRMSDVAAYREIDVRALAEDIERAGGMTRLAARTQASPAAVTNLEPAFRYLPFARDEVAARAAFKAWTQGLLMVPKGFAEQAALQSLSACWVPHWRACAPVSAVWHGRRGEPRPAPQADAGTATPADSRDNTEWTPAQGELKALFSDLLLTAAALDDGAPTLLSADQLPGVQTADVLPDTAVPIKPTSVDRAQAQTQAEGRIHEQTTERAKKQIAGSKREITHLDRRIDSLALEVVMAPAWEGSYSHGGKTYALWVSGATGAVGAQMASAISSRLTSSPR